MFKLFKFRTSYDVIRVQTPENCMWFVFTTNLNRQASERASGKVFVLRDSSRQLRVSVLLLVMAGNQSETRAVAFCKTKNPPFSLVIHCMFLFSLKFRRLQRLFLNENIVTISWNVCHVLKTAWKWSSWSLVWELDGTNVSFISHIHVRCLG